MLGRHQIPVYTIPVVVLDSHKKSRSIGYRAVRLWFTQQIALAVGWKYEGNDLFYLRWYSLGYRYWRKNCGAREQHNQKTERPGHGGCSLAAAQFVVHLCPICGFYYRGGEGERASLVSAMPATGAVKKWRRHRCGGGKERCV